MIRLLMIPLLLILAACGTIKERMEPWVGKHQDQLISTWGPPTNSATLTDGRQSLVYVTQGYNTEFGLRCYGTCRKVFTTDKSGVVHSFNYSGCC
jgi:cytochrome c oxidase assembly factor CtaG